MQDFLIPRLTKAANFGLRRSGLSVVAIAILAFFGIGAQVLHAQVYDLVDLAAPPENGQKAFLSMPAAMNDRAQVTGIADLGSGNQSAFLYRPRNEKETAVEYLDENPAISSRGFGINSVGDVVGDVSIARQRDVRHATLFRNGKTLDLGVLQEGDSSRANSINASGLVVGFSGPGRDSNASRAFLWSAATGMVDLGTLGGKYAQAFAINDSGYVTGTSQVSPLISHAPGGTHAFLYQPLSIPAPPIVRMLDLGTLGGQNSYGTAINASNHVVGYSLINTFDNRIHAFLHDGTQLRDLGSLGPNRIQTDNSAALGINGIDQVVGWTLIEPNSEFGISAPNGPVQQVAFIYTNGIMRNLNDLIGDAAKNYLLFSATAINNKGQIIASALDRSTNQVRAVLLTP